MRGRVAYVWTRCLLFAELALGGREESLVEHDRDLVQVSDGERLGQVGQVLESGRGVALACERHTRKRSSGQDVKMR